jgi:hypothetical protein
MNPEPITLDEDLDATSNGPIVILPAEVTPEEPTSAKEEEPEYYNGRKLHKRAGYTTNKGNGESKARRKMAKRSRRINRGK